MDKTGVNVSCPALLSSRDALSLSGSSRFGSKGDAHAGADLKFISLQPHSGPHFPSNLEMANSKGAKRQAGAKSAAEAAAFTAPF